MSHPQPLLSPVRRPVRSNFYSFIYQCKKAFERVPRAYLIPWVLFIFYVAVDLSVFHVKTEPPVIEEPSNPFWRRRHGEGNATVPMTLVVPCVSEDFGMLPMHLMSLANQTVYPQETVLVLDVLDKDSDGSLLFYWSSDEAREKAADFDHFMSDIVHSQRSYKGRKRSEKLVERHLERPLSEADFNNVPPLKQNETDLSDMVSVEEAVDYIAQIVPSLKHILEAIPGLKIFVRSGKHYAGDNRSYGFDHARDDSTVISFFDCDDYLHPDRTKLLYELFETMPELDAVIHAFHHIPIQQWRRQIVNFLEPRAEPPTLYEGEKFHYSFETLRKVIERRIKLPKGTKEPNIGPGSRMWWFPRDLGLGRLKGSPLPHNGWITVRREVLEEIPYPDTPTGQDSIFNWRILKSNKNFNFYPVALGGYVRTGGN